MCIIEKLFVELPLPVKSKLVSDVPVESLAPLYVYLLEKQAETGSKMYDSKKPEEYENNYSFYLSEIELTNNCVFLTLCILQGADAWSC